LIRGCPRDGSFPSMNLYVVSSKIPTAGEPLLRRTAAGMARRPRLPRELDPVSEDGRLWVRAAGEREGCPQTAGIEKDGWAHVEKMKETAGGGP